MNVNLENHMHIRIAAFAFLLLAACEGGGDTLSFNRSPEQEQIDAAEEEAKRQISERADAEEERVEAQADNARARLELQQAESEAQQKNEATNIETQTKKIDDSVAAGQKQVQDAMHSDQQLTQQIKQNLGLTDPNSPRAKQIQVEVLHGKLTLRGTVANEQEKNDIENQVRNIPGINEVDNELEVQS
jgi:osmotically-inducible protein OsmY